MSLGIDAAFQADPAQLGDTSFICDANEAGNYLTNDVHPLWAYRNWSRDIVVKHMPRMENAEFSGKRLTKRVAIERCAKLPAETYETILPAIRLASLFLEKSLPWFWKLRYAGIKDIGNHGRKLLQVDDGEWTPEKEQQIRDEFDTIAEQYYLLHGSYGWEMKGTGMSSFTCRTLDPDVEPPPEEARGKIWIKKAQISVVAKESIEFIESDDWLQLPLALQHRCLFQLAVLLVHEVAHVVGFCRPEGTRALNEAYFRDDEPAREYGFSWEYWMFGGLISAVDGEMTGNKPEDTEEFGIRRCDPGWQHPFHSHVLMYSDWKHHDFSLDDFNHSPDRWLVVSKSIEQFFDRELWARWLAMPLAAPPPGVAPLISPFAIRLAPSCFMVLFHQNSRAYDSWYRHRLRHAAINMCWADIVAYESDRSDSDFTFYSGDEGESDDSGDEDESDGSGEYEPSEEFDDDSDDDSDDRVSDPMDLCFDEDDFGPGDPMDLT